MPYTALVVAVVLVPGIIAIRQGFDSLTSRSQTFQLSLARLLADRVGAVLREKLQTVEGIARLDSVRAMKRGPIDEDITKARLHQRAFTSLFVLDEKGTVVSFVDRPWLVGRDLSFRDYFKAVRESGRSYFSNSILTVEKTITVIISTPIVGEGGRMVGVLAGSFDVDHPNFNRLIVEARIGQTGHAYLVDRRGVLFAHRDTGRALRQEDLSGQPPVRSVMAGRPGTEIYRRAGDEILAAHAPIEPSGWGVVVERSLADANAPAARLRTLIAISLIASTVVAALVSLILSGRIVAPLVRLGQAARALGRGDFAQRVEGQGSGEIAALAGEFNRMAEGIQRAQVELVGARDGAERGLTQLGLALEAGRAGTYELDLGTDVGLCSPEFEKLHGIPPGDLSGKNRAEYETCILDEDRQALRAALRQAMDGGGVISRPYRIRRRDTGELRWMETRGHVLYDADRRPRTFLGVTLDITEPRRAEEMTRGLASVSRGLAGCLDFAAAARLVTQGLVRLGGIRRSLLYTRDAPTGVLTCVAAAGDGDPSQWIGKTLAPGEGLSGVVVKEGRALSSPDQLSDRRFSVPPWVVEQSLSDDCRALAVVPLVIEGEVLGTLTFGDTTGRVFSEAEIQLVAAFAGDAALALRNARLFAENERRRREAEIMADVVSVISASLDLDTVLQRVVAGAREICGSDMASIVLPVPGTGVMMPRASMGARLHQWDRIAFGPGQGLSGRVALTRRPARTDDYLGEPGIAGDHAALAREEGLVTGLLVPIEIAGRLEGVIAVFNRVRRPFSDGDEAILLRLADHAAIAIANARLYRQLQETGERLHALSRQLMGAQEAERRRLARELHDELGQALTAVKLNLQSLPGPGASAGAGGRLDEAMGLVDRALSQVRDLSLDLRPSLLDDLGLASALRWYVTRQAERAGLAATVAADLGETRPGPDIETACFRVVQEAMTNAVRHGGARSVSVEVKGREGEIALVVRDDGAGFDVEAAHSRATRGESLGLLGMEERVLLLGGTLDIDSAPGQGTEVRARIPLGPRSGSTGHSEGGTGS